MAMNCRTGVAPDLGTLNLRGIPEHATRRQGGANWPVRYGVTAGRDRAFKEPPETGRSNLSGEWELQGNRKENCSIDHSDPQGPVNRCCSLIGKTGETSPIGGSNPSGTAVEMNAGKRM